MDKVDVFRDDAVLFYWGSSPSREHDKRTLKLYHEALDEVSSWLKDILEREVREKGLGGASARIYFPEDLVVRVEGTGRGYPETFKTPVGEIDEYTYKAIIRTPDNPAKKLLDYLKEGSYAFEVSIADACRERGCTMITKELMQACNLQDPLHLHRMFPMLYEYEKFMSDMYENGSRCPG